MTEKIKHGWDVSAEGFNRVIGDDFKPENMKSWCELILSMAPHQGKLNILDVGTGPGFFSVILSAAGHQLTGIDISAPMLEQARNNAKLFGVTPEFFLMDSQNPTFPQAHFDMIISRNVVWCMEKPYEAYKNWRELLKPGGVVLVIDGDHLRDIRDETYRKECETLTQRYIETFGETPPVSYSDFETARGWRTELPLVHCERPKWDISVMKSLGYRNVCCKDVSSVAYNDEKQKLLYQNAPLFMLSGER